MIAALLASGVLTSYAPPPPAANITPEPNYNQTCAAAGLTSRACLVSTVGALDYARRQEGLGPLYLPKNWLSLKPAEQLLVITNLERTARGERPIPGLTAALDAVAKAGAAQHRDPTLAPGVAPSVSIWAEGAGPLASDYGWMYFDGWNGPLQKTPNLACSSATAAGCWGHRDNILAEWSRRLLANDPGTWYLAAGAAQTSMANPVGLSPVTLDSDAMIVTAVAKPPQYVYTWAQAVAEGAGNSKTGWNPLADRTAVAAVEALAWARAHIVEISAVLAAAILVLRGKRRTTRRVAK